MGTLKILLVDDDRNLATTLSHGLRKGMGGTEELISVAVCLSGAEALSILATQAFDVVVSDFNMPGPTGLELLNRLRQDHRDIILVLITAYGTDALEEGLRQLGAGYITKPFEPACLVQLIKDLIRGQETRGKIENVAGVMDKLGKSAGSSQDIHIEASA